MAFFNEDDLEQLWVGCEELPEKFNALREAYVIRQYRDDGAREHANHGFCRRLGSLRHGVERVFDLLPPEVEDIPNGDRLADATMAIQAFVMNCFGCLENLAWIWVLERDIRKPNGQRLKPMQIGLTEAPVLASFSPEFQAHLQARRPWLDHLIGFRDSLAHRIPLYIPPYIVEPANLDRYYAIEAEMTRAARAGDEGAYDRAEREQLALAHFRPWMVRSLNEQSDPVLFHSQLLQDYVAIDEFGWKILDELARQPTPGST